MLMALSTMWQDLETQNTYFVNHLRITDSERQKESGGLGLWAVSHLSLYPRVLSYSNKQERVSENQLPG